MTSLSAFLSPTSLTTSPHFHGTALKSHTNRIPSKRHQNHLHPNIYIPQCTFSKHSIAAGLASLTLFLSGHNQTPPPSAVAMSSSSPSLELNTQTQKPVQRIISNRAKPLAIVGVGRSTIHDYNSTNTPEARTIIPAASTTTTAVDIETAHALADLEDARREAALAARLITAVLLGCLLGVERRATMLNLGVRSVTITSLSAAIVSVITTSTDVTGVPSIFPLAAVAPALSAITVGLVAGLTAYFAASSRLRITRNKEHMSAIIGIVVTMGAACGAGISLLAAISYFAAVFVMRSRQQKERGTSLKFSRGGDANLRIGKPDTIREDGEARGGRMMEVGSGSPPPLDSMS